MNKLEHLWSSLHSSLWFLHLRVRRATCHHPHVLRAALSGFLWWSAPSTPVMALGDASGLISDEQRTSLSNENES